jgi:hypothetical protein
MVTNGEDIPVNPTGENPEKQHRPGRKRIRYKIRKKKKPFPQRAKKAILKLLMKRWLLILLAALALIGVLLWGFLEVERSTIKEASHQTEIE